MKSLVVYYSLFGNAKFVAKELARELGTEAHKVNEFAMDTSGYDLIVVGGPMWAGKVRWPVLNFLKRNDFTGKKVAFFCTQDGSEDNPFPDMEAAASSKPVSTKKFAKAKKDSETTIQEVKEWAKTLK